MSTACLERGAIVHIDGKKYRLLRQVEEAWQLEQAKTGRVLEHSELELLRMIAENRLKFPGSLSVTNSKPVGSGMSPSDLEIAKLRRSYVLAVLDVPNTRKRLEDAIHAVWTRVKSPAARPAYTTVYRWKNAFLKSKGDIRSLVDNTQSRGNRNNRYPSEVMNICEQSISAKYLNRVRCTIQQTLDYALFRVQKENKLRPAGDALPLPTRRLITRIIANIPAFDKHAARFGKDAAIKEFRAVQGHSVARAPLERAEIDHTLLDLMVVDDKSGLPLGRPSVTACIDCYTRCVLGIYVGFTPPSYQSVAACLKDCFMPKVKLKDDYPEIVNEWPAYGVMRNLVVDGGLEFYSASLEQVCLSLNINWIAAPRRTAWFKPHIERFFGTMNRAVAHGVPGTTFSDVLEKGDYDPASQAVVTLTTLQKVIRMWIVDVYHEQVHRALQTTPAKMWRSSIRPEEIQLPDETTQLDVVMGRVETRTLTHKGIEFEGLFYNSPEITELRRKEGTNLKVEIRINESNIGSIYLLSPKTAIPYSVPALDQDYAAGLSLWQHKVIKNYQRRHSNSDPSVAGWLEAKDQISRLIEESFKLKRTRTHKRIARYIETTRPASSNPPRHDVPSPEQLNPAAETNRHDPLKEQDLVHDGVEMAPFARPRFTAEIGEFYNGR